VVLQTNSTPSGGSVYQNMPVTPLVGQNFSATVWVRCGAPCPSGISGSFFLHAVDSAGVGQSSGTSFTVSGVDGWKPVTASLDVLSGGRVELRGQIYLNTPTRNFDVDAAASSVSVCKSTCTS
jgi:hypothetical protein